MIKKGIISNCRFVNLRETPNKKSKVLATIPFDTRVEVDLDASAKTYYNVTFENKVGYCIRACVVIV